MPHNIPAFFESYANLYNRALAGEDVFEEIMKRFAPQFIAAGPQGVSTGKQGAAFRRMLEKGYRFYREIGTQKMTSKRVEVTPIDAGHSMAKVFYCADYLKPDGSPLRLDFDVTYLLDTSTLKPKIFGFIAATKWRSTSSTASFPRRPVPRQSHAPSHACRITKDSACIDGGWSADHAHSVKAFRAGTILLALSATDAGHATAQAALLSSQSADIEHRLRESEQGYDIAGRRYVLGQSLAEDREARHTLPVERGAAYFGLALCEEGCGGIDLVVEDEAGNVVDNDEAGRNDPVLLFRAEKAGRITIVVSMKECGEDVCEYGLGFHTLRGNPGRD